MDDLDRAILEKLCEDARLSQRKLAQLLGVAQGTVTKDAKDGGIRSYQKLRSGIGCGKSGLEYDDYGRLANSKKDE